LFAIPAETKALRKLLEAVPQEQVEYVVNHLVELSSNKYCPDITKPTALYKN
jgi:hypothetical protein